MSASTLRDRFSLDYLVSGPNAQPQTQASTLPAGVEPFLESFGAQVTQALKSAPNYTATAFALAQQCSIRMDVLIQVMQYLSSKGVVKQIAAEPSGNNTYELV